MPHAPDVGSTVDPISTKGARLCSPYYYRPFPGLLDLPTATIVPSIGHIARATELVLCPTLGQKGLKKLASYFYIPS